MQSTHNLHWKDIPRDLITDFLDDYQSHVDQQQTTSALRDFIDLQHPSHLTDWDVVIIKNKRGRRKIKVKTNSNTHILHAVKRKATDYDENKLAIKRIGAPTDEMLDFDKITKEEIIANFKASEAKSLTVLWLENIETLHVVC